MTWAHRWDSNPQWEVSVMCVSNEVYYLVALRSATSIIVEVRRHESGVLSHVACSL